MTNGELLRLLEEHAKVYRSTALQSLVKNNYLTNLDIQRKEINQYVIDSILVDFINAIGTYHGCDYGLILKNLETFCIKSPRLKEIKRKTINLRV